jgi:hypothetical protein
MQAHHAPGPRGHVPVPVLVLLALLLPAGPLGWLATRGGAEPRRAPGAPLERIAARAGCRLTEFQDGMRTNPPVTGRFRERDRAADGSYVGRRSPSLAATTHALFHGRVLVQYRRDLPPAGVKALDRFARRGPTHLLLFENRTRMPAPVAATAYLSLLTCPRVDRRTLAALAAFHNRRRGFGQEF